MVQKTFAIYSGGTATDLYLELGSAQLACWCREAASDKIQAFELFEFGIQQGRDDFAEVLRQVQLHSKLLDTRFAACTVIWENEECVLVPGHYTATAAADYLNLVHGQLPGAVVQQQQLPQANAVFRLPAQWKSLLDQYYPGATHQHKFPAWFGAGPMTNGARVCFYRGHFLMTLYRNDLPQLVQRFHYHTPEDVIYHLLNALEQHGVAPETAVVHVSGLIDLNSAMYKELYKYLYNLQVEEGSSLAMDAEAFKAYPQHYFLPFFKTAA